MKRKLYPIPIILSSLIGMGVYNLCVFMLCDEYTMGFWLVYGFTMLAFFVQLVLPLLYMVDKDIQRDKYISFPFTICGSLYFSVQLITGILLMALSVSTKSALVIEVVMFGAFASILLSLIMGKKAFATDDKEYVDKTTFIKDLRRKVEVVCVDENDVNTKAELKKLYDAVRYADPISHTNEIHSINAEIEDNFNLVCRTLTGDVEQLKVIVKRTIDLVNKRNIACKSNK